MAKCVFDPARLQTVLIPCVDNDMRICTEINTPRQYCQLVEKFSGEKIILKEVSYEDFEKLKGVPELEEIWAK